MRRVVVVGPGAAGKSTLAVRLGDITGLPVIELDKLFWRPGLTAAPRDQWAAIQRELASQESWIMDGDLGPYDVIEVRLRAADTVVFLDFSPLRCAWRAIRRSRERADFWRWLFSYRRRSRPLLLQAIAVHAGDDLLGLATQSAYTLPIHCYCRRWHRRMALPEGSSPGVCGTSASVRERNQSYGLLVGTKSSPDNRHVNRILCDNRRAAVP